MYEILNEKDKELIEKISKITLTNYETGSFIKIETWKEIIYDLLDEIYNLQEKIEDIEQDIESNYKPIPYEEQIGYNERDFIEIL